MNEQDELEGKQHHGVTEEEQHLPGKISNGLNGIAQPTWQLLSAIPEVHDLQQVSGPVRWRCGYSCCCCFCRCTLLLPQHMQHGRDDRASTLHNAQD